MRDFSVEGKPCDWSPQVSKKSEETKHVRMLTGEHNARWFRGLVGGERKQIQFLAESNLVEQRLIKIALPKQLWFVETAFEKKVNILTTNFQIYVKTIIAGRWLCDLKHILLSPSTLGFKHLYERPHNCLQFLLERIQCPLFASVDTCMHMHILHTNTSTNTHNYKYIKQID